MDDRLYRSRTDRMIGGVAAGVARSLNIDPTIVRVVWVVLAFATGGVAVLVYFVLLFVMPEEPEVPGGRPVGGFDDRYRSTDATGDSPVEPAGTPAGGPSAWGSGVGPRGPGEAGSFAPGSSTPSPAAPARSDDSRTAALVFGVILVSVGAWFLVREWLPAFDLSVTWPYVAVGLGVVLVAASLFSGRRTR